jgi:hypothetical protein
MTEPATTTLDDDDMDFLDAEMTPAEWIEVIDDSLAEAVEDLIENEAGIRQLVSFLRRKATELSALADECEPQEIDEEVPD